MVSFAEIQRTVKSHMGVFNVKNPLKVAEEVAEYLVLDHVYKIVTATPGGTQWVKGVAEQMNAIAWERQRATGGKISLFDFVLKVSRKYNIASLIGARAMP